MKKLMLSMSLAMALSGSQVLQAHSPMDEIPDLNQFKEKVEDWERFDSFYANQELDIVDIHLHPGSYDKLGPKGKEFVKSVFPINLPDFIKVPILRFLSSFQLNPYGAFIGIKNECRKASASHCFLYATYAPETWGIEPNEDLIGYLDDGRNSFEDKPYFFGLASLDVSNWGESKSASLNNLRSALEHPYVVGIKLAFAHTLTPFDDPQYHDIYEVAKTYDKPIYHHVGTSPLRKVSEFSEEERPFVLRTFDPMYLEEAIKAYPDVKFILGHAGNDANQEGFSKINEAFYLAEKYENVFIEISALGSERSDPNGELMDSVLLRAKNNGIVNKILYGSDGPGNPGKTESYKDLVLASMERVGYSFQEAQLVMGTNSRRLFKLP